MLVVGIPFGFAQGRLSTAAVLRFRETRPPLRMTEIFPPLAKDRSASGESRPFEAQAEDYSLPPTPPNSAFALERQKPRGYLPLIPKVTHSYTPFW